MLELLEREERSIWNFFREILGGPNLAGDGFHLASQLLKQLELC